MPSTYQINRNHIPKELLLQLEMLQLQVKEQLSTNQLMQVNWESFLDLAAHHRLYSPLYPKLLMLDKELVPSFVLRELQQYFKINTLQMLYFSAEMEKIGTLFAEQDIRTIFLKGPVLAADLYGDVSLRTSSDLDLLIPIEDLCRAEQLLIENGYEKDDYIKTVLNDWKWRHHHITFIHPQKQMKVEVHWRLNPGPGKEPSFANLWERKRISNITKHPIYILGREDLFLFLVAHGARHGWSRLRWLLDIHQSVQQPLDWSLLEDLLHRYQCSQLAGQALILSAELLGTAIPRQMKHITEGSHPKRLAQEAIFYLERMVNLHTEPVPDDISVYHKRHLFSLMSSKQKVLFLLSFLHPYPEDAETLPLPKSLHLLYFPLRPLLWVWRKVSRQPIS